MRLVTSSVICHDSSTQGSGVRMRDLSEGVRRAICLSSCAKRSLRAVSSCCLPHEPGGGLTSSVTPKTGCFERGVEMGAELAGCSQEEIGCSQARVAAPKRDRLLPSEIGISQARVGLRGAGLTMLAGSSRCNLAASEWVSPCSASCAEIARSSRLSSSRCCRNMSNPHSPDEGGNQGCGPPDEGGNQHVQSTLTQFHEGSEFSGAEVAGAVRVEREPERPQPLLRH